ncbi:NAD(P)H-dependent oxidoreductase [Stappia sp.]|uniref:NAD(P)H-dependent oxidoreductase n=1 Tax=Stappia sp. TaxID=1870903 RepID=UPI003A99D0D2
MPDRLRIAVLYGSAREGRFCGKVGDWLMRGLRGMSQFEIDLIDPLELDLPVRLEAEEGATVKAYLRRIDAADGFIVVTPEYNHGYTADLKYLIDNARAEWKRKPVGFVSYGGVAGGLRAVEQLRLVFAELHAVGLRDGVSFANPWNCLDENGVLADTQASAKALALMMDEMNWWAGALKRARGAEPGTRTDFGETGDGTPGDTWTLVNSFLPHAGRTGEFLALQLAETREMWAEAAGAGWLGNEVYVARDGDEVVVVTRFASRAAQEAFAASKSFARHRTRIAPLLKDVRSTPVRLVARHVGAG